MDPSNAGNHDSAEVGADSDAARGNALSWKWSALFAAFGSLALSTQTYLLREFIVALGGDEAAVGLGLGTWLAGIAMGAAWARRWSQPRLAAMAGPLVALLAVSGLLELTLSRLGRAVLQTPSGEFVPLSQAVLLAAEVFLLPSCLIGIGFVALAASAARAREARDAISQLYVFESLGSLAAGMLISLVLLPHTQPTTGYAIVLALSVALALPAAHARWVTAHRPLALLTLALACVCLTPLGARLEAANQRARFASLVQNVRLLDFTDTPYEHLDLGEGESHPLYVDGTYAGSLPDPLEDEARAHALMLLAQNPAHVLILGNLPASMLRFVLQHPVKHLDWVTLDRKAFDFVSRHLPAPDRAALVDPRTHITFQDPRGFLKQTHAKYDLVLMLERDPATLLLARHTTAEFARAIAAHLAADGTYVTRLASGPNVQTGQTALLGASLYRTLQQAFQFVRATPEPHGLLLAGATAEAVSLDIPTLTRCWQQRAISTEVFAPELLPDEYPGERIATLNAELAAAARTSAVSHDDQPVSFLHAFIRRQQLAQGLWAQALNALLVHPWLTIAMVLFPSIGVFGSLLHLQPRQRSAVATIHAAAIVGATGMALSILLFFSFQTQVGALYSELGLLSGLFMLGLAIGGTWGNRRVSIVQAQLACIGSTGITVCVWLLARKVPILQEHAATVHELLLLLVGSATGLMFPAACSALLASGHDSRTAAAWVEAADHGGAALVALITVVILVPVLGLTHAALVLLALQALSMGVTRYSR